MGVHVGGGLLGFFSPRLGARVDLRYFRNVSGDEAGGSLLDFDLGAFDFWRATIGFILRF